MWEEDETVERRSKAVDLLRRNSTRTISKIRQKGGEGSR